MALTKKQKKEILDDLKDKIAQQKAIVFVDYTGLKVKDLSKLRKKLRESDSLFRVAKKTLLRIAFKDSKSSLADEVEKLEGQIGIIFGFEDEISPAKISYKFSKDIENLKILGGSVEGNFIGREQVLELAKIPGREELLGRLVGSISAPASNLVSVLQGNIKGLIFALSAIKK